MSMVEGGCQCGAVRLVARGKPHGVGVCPLDAPLASFAHRLTIRSQPLTFGRGRRWKGGSETGGDEPKPTVNEFAR